MVYYGIFSPLISYSILWLLKDKLPPHRHSSKDLPGATADALVRKWDKHDITKHSILEDTMRS